MSRGRGNGSLQIELLMLAFINNFHGLRGETAAAKAARERTARREGLTTTQLQDWLDRYGGFVSYATARRRRFGKAAGCQVARTDISRAARRLEREGLVQRMSKGIKITPAGETWLHERVQPEIERDYMWRTIMALERKRFTADDLAYVPLLIMSNYKKADLAAACERLFYAYKGLPAHQTDLGKALSKRPGPPGSLLPQ
jgi:hypothetical protein